MNTFFKSIFLALVSAIATLWVVYVVVAIILLYEVNYYLVGGFPCQVIE